MRLGIHLSFPGERVDGRPCVLDHVAHLRPPRIFVVESGRLDLARAEAGLVEGEDGVSCLGQRQHGMDVVVIDPAIAERRAVAMQPDHGRQLGVRGSVVGRKKVGLDGAEAGRAGKGDLAFGGLAERRR